MSDEVVRQDELELDGEEQAAEKQAAEKKPAGKKSAKPANKKKQGEKAVSRYLRELKSEFKKIIWPSRSSLVRNTVVTLIMCAIMGAIISLFDLGLGALINLLMSLK